MEIKLIDKSDIHKIIPLLQLLNKELETTIIATRLDEMVKQGYQCAGIYHQEKLIGICGIWILTKYYIGKHIEPDNMVFLPEYRSQGLGKKLIEWIHQYGKSLGCVASELNCYLANERGQKFWQTEGYDKIAFHFQKKL